MLKIRISYDRQQEAERVLKALSPVIKGAKIRKSDRGKYPKLYIEASLERSE